MKHGEWTKIPMGVFLSHYRFTLYLYKVGSKYPTFTSWVFRLCPVNGSKMSGIESWPEYQMHLNTGLMSFDLNFKHVGYLDPIGIHIISQVNLSLMGTYQFMLSLKNAQVFEWHGKNCGIFWYSYDLNTRLVRYSGYLNYSFWIQVMIICGIEIWIQWGSE